MLWCAVCFSVQHADPDLWGHVQYGRDLLTVGLDHSNTYSYSAPGYPWINHENLSEILLALGADTIGGPGLAIAKCCLGWLVILLIFHRAQTLHLSVVSGCVVALLFGVNARSGWTMRPQLVTYVSFALMISLVSWCFLPWETAPNGPSSRWRPIFRQTLPSLDGRDRYLWCLPMLFVVWANAHGGFVAGYLVLATYLLGRSVEAAYAHGKEALPLVLHLLAILTACGLATLLNPYGIGLHRWLADSVLTPRPEIVEWHALDWARPKAWNFVLLVVAAALSIGLGTCRIDYLHLVILSLVAFQSIQHRRHAVFFAILFSFWILPHVDSYLRPALAARASSWSHPLRAGRLLTLVLSIVCLVLGVNVGSQLRGIGVPKHRYPVDALQFMADSQLVTGRIVVAFSWAQYVIDALGHRHSDRLGLLVGIDGRFRTCYPQETLDIYLDFELANLTKRFRSSRSGPIDSERALQLGEPDLVLVHRGQRNAVHVMASRQEQWTLLYQDGLSQLWGRADQYDDPNSARYVAAANRRIGDSISREVVPWPALPKGRRHQTKPAD